MRHNCQSCGEMTVNLLANRRNLNMIFVSFCIRPKRDLRNSGADVTSCVNGVAGIDFLCENIAFIVNNKYK